jgi:DNA-binding LytR/AlgR family response regulator
MRLLNTLIVESDTNAAEALKAYLNDLPFVGPPHLADSAAEAITKMRGNAYEVIFWGTHLPDSRGLGILKSFPTLPSTIVVGSDGDCAIEAFEIGVLDFLPKPFTFERFLKAINRLKQYHLTKNSVSDQDTTFLKVGRQMKRFYYNDIICVEALASYTKVITKKGVVVVNENLTELLAKLPQELFMRIHKSYIINLTHLSAFDTKKVVVSELEVPLGFSYRPSFEKYLYLLND